MTPTSTPPGQTSVEPPHHITVREALSRIPESGERFVRLFERSGVEVEIYAPFVRDLQSPHTRDELYLIISGSGYFINGPGRVRFSPGDLLFVEAGVEHRFEEFTHDFATWVIFFGPEGGK
jgi:mannose-6-phosphate isomerase-like protein (cupin superfamily)